eukprot:6208568-Pleurochrysis_carterae.AAC.2
MSFWRCEGQRQPSQTDLAAIYLRYVLYGRAGESDRVFQHGWRRDEGRNGEVLQVRTAVASWVAEFRMTYVGNIRQRQGPLLENPVMVVLKYADEP